MIRKQKHTYIGAHTSITPTILNGIQYMYKLGANAIQILQLQKQLQRRQKPHQQNQQKVYC